MILAAIPRRQVEAFLRDNPRAAEALDAATSRAVAAVRKLTSISPGAEEPAE